MANELLWQVNLNTAVLDAGDWERITSNWRMVVRMRQMDIIETINNTKGKFKSYDLIMDYLLYLAQLNIEWKNNRWFSIKI